MKASQAYLESVKECKRLLKLQKVLKYEIAKISLKWCPTKIGGRVSPETYTLERFSNDIGMSAKELTRLRREYELVVSKVGGGKEKVDRRSLEKTMKEVDRGMSKEAVRKKYETNKKLLAQDHNLHFQDILRRLKNFQFDICQKYNINDIDAEIVDGIKSAISTIHSHLSGEKKLKKNKKAMVLAEIEAVYQ